MRTPTLALVILLSLSGYAQFNPDSRWHGGVGISGGSINFQQNGVGALALPLYYNLVKTGRSSLSLGTNAKIGSEDINGISFPIVLGLLVAGAQTNTTTDFNGADLSDRVRFFGDFPLLLHYNWGLGAGTKQQRQFGFYLGGGLDYTLSGYTNQDDNERGIDFLGWMADAGIRWGKGGELGFSTSFPFSNSVGNIQNPVLYQMHIAFYYK
jgi:hypothetical protein